MNNLINYAGLKSKHRSFRRQFTSAHPFPHCVLEDFLLPGACEQIASGFSKVLIGRAARDPERRRHLDVHRKIATNDLAIMTSAQRNFFAMTQSPEFIEFLTSITGIDDLTADPSLIGSGLHEIHPGGFLNIHADFNVHPQTGMLRRLNLLLYLNAQWQEDWQGHLELWPHDMTGPPVRITPKINRAVLFETSDTSWHGHPSPLNCPSGITRKSLALYYYSPWSGDRSPRSRTSYVLTPEQRADLEGRLSASMADLDSESEACRLISDYRTKHVVEAYRRLKETTEQ